MQEIILFIMTFIFVFIIYEVFVVRKERKGKGKKKPVEIRYLEAKYQLDMKKLNYKRLLHVVSLVSAFDITLLVSFVFFLDSFLITIVLGAILIIPIIMFSYHFVGVHFKEQMKIFEEKQKQENKKQDKEKGKQKMGRKKERKNV